MLTKQDRIEKQKAFDRTKELIEQLKKATPPHQAGLFPIDSQVQSED